MFVLGRSPSLPNTYNALHNQVKCMAKQVWEASHRVDQLIGTAPKQMMLNINVIKDFGMLLHVILFDMLTTQDFYCSIQLFYVGLLAWLVNDYGKNNLYIINIAHSFKNFLQTCDFVEPLPDGMAQFTGMMASIIQDIVGRKMVWCISHLWRLVSVIGICRYYHRLRIPSFSSLDAFQIGT